MSRDISKRETFDIYGEYIVLNYNIIVLQTFPTVIMVCKLRINDLIFLSRFMSSAPKYFIV